jgi:hypothetical protein
VFVAVVIGALCAFVAVMFAASYRWDFAEDRRAGKAIVVSGARDAEEKATALKEAGSGPEVCAHFWVDVPFDYNDLSAKATCRRVMAQ